MRENLISTRTSAMAVVLVLGVTLGVAAQQGGPRTAEQQFKNIRVMKGVPAMAPYIGLGPDPVQCGIPRVNRPNTLVETA